MFQPPEKYEFVRLDWIIPTIGENKKNVPNHQAATNIDMGLSEKWSPHSHNPPV